MYAPLKYFTVYFLYTFKLQSIDYLMLHTLKSQIKYNCYKERFKYLCHELMC